MMNFAITAVHGHTDGSFISHLAKPEVGNESSDEDIDTEYDSEECDTSSVKRRQSSVDNMYPDIDDRSIQSKLDDYRRWLQVKGYHSELDHSGSIRSAKRRENLLLSSRNSRYQDHVRDHVRNIFYIMKSGLL